MATTKTAEEPDVTVHSPSDTSRTRMRVKGDEMSPSIPAGALVELEPCDQVRGGGGRYMIELDGHQLLQHVQRKPGRRLRLCGVNDAHDPAVIRRRDDGTWATDAGHPVQFEVIGRYIDVVQTEPSAI